MANHKGSEGVVQVGSNDIAEIRGWSLNESAGTMDDSNLNDEWETHKAARKAWDGQFDAFWDETDTNGQQAMTIGAEVTLNLRPEGAVATGKTFFTGSAIITGKSKSAQIDGIVEQSFTFKGNGALTESTDP